MHRGSRHWPAHTPSVDLPACSRVNTPKATALNRTLLCRTQSYFKSLVAEYRTFDPKFHEDTPLHATLPGNVPLCAPHVSWTNCLISLRLMPYNAACDLTALSVLRSGAPVTK